MAREFIALFSQKEGEALIRRHCRQVGLEVADLKRLVEEVIERDSMGRRHGLRQTFDDILENSVSDGIPAP